ncbi:MULTISPECIES: DUF2199 domain-containing protein [Cyanophyceae]|nr:DUF2199 domain-containing protein [Nodosilinea sp. FACHB-141]
MLPFLCSVCGQYHDNLLMDLAYQRPADVFKVPANERPQRIRVNEDLCIIDDTEFYIRGVLMLPVHELVDSFRWGVWAQVDKEAFDYYHTHWNVPSTDNFRSLYGVLSGGISAYPNSDQLMITIHLQANNQRPLFVVLNQKHPLGEAQRQGISLHDIEKFIAPVVNR